MSWVASAVHQHIVSQVVSACYCHLLPLCYLLTVKEQGLDLWLGLPWPFSYLAYVELVKSSEVQ